MNTHNGRVLKYIGDYLNANWELSKVAQAAVEFLEHGRN